MKKRDLYAAVLARHHIRVIRWRRGLKADVESTVPRSYFDFSDDLEKANAEYRQLVG